MTYPPRYDVFLKTLKNQTVETTQNSRKYHKSIHTSITVISVKAFTVVSVYVRNPVGFPGVVFHCNGLGRIVVIFAVNLKEKPTDALIIYSVLML